MNVVIRVVLSGSESFDLAKHSKNGAMFLFSKFTTFHDFSYKVWLMCCSCFII